MMTIIGITGGTGGGKTSALRALQSLGALIIDCDAVYHELLRTNGDMLAALEKRFEGVVKNGALDRKALGRVVFNDEKALEDLNRITHAYVKIEVDNRLRAWEAQCGTLAAIDAIALIESGLSDLCDILVGVTAPSETRIRRIMERDGVDEDYARLRVAAQKPDSYYKEHCDYVLVSDFPTVEEFEEKCRKFFTDILNKK
jgi:dephospho-CoA kinase